ncbi:cache domain-containing protein [bacterium]|jgi:two-component system NtrC family sensor kinase|nr:cache domain-containing protein [bacterium]
MKKKTLKSNLIISFLTVITALGIAVAFIGFYLIKTEIFDRAQTQVQNDLKIAWSVYKEKTEKLKIAFNMFEEKENLEVLKEKLGLDYLFLADITVKNRLKSEIALKAFGGTECGGTRIIGGKELRQMDADLAGRCAIDLLYTPMAVPTEETVLDSVMAIEYAKPFFASAGKVNKVIYGGRILNKDTAVVDRIRSFVFGNKQYKGMPLGTVTIFQGDVRVSTNVPDKEGNRATGTRVSKEVYEKVIKNGYSWFDRAFVVTAWYITAYEPIRNINGEIIGMLYVGILEKPYADLFRNVGLFFFLAILIAVFIAVILGLILAESISKPVREVLYCTGKFSGGDLSCRVGTQTKIKELNQLAEAFNEMAKKLSQRDKSLKVSNEKLDTLNRSYIDLIGFVAHELKGILSSTMLNAYSVRDGFLGLINFKQRKALDSVCKNLDYFAATVKNYLSLSRIEKGEMKVSRTEVLLKEDIFDDSVEYFLKQAADKNIEISNNIEKGLTVKADPDLLRMAANNIIGNAVKYGSKDGKIIITSGVKGDMMEISVYNDGRPVTEEEKGKLFKKFSRLDAPEVRRVQGTGLGLFITMQIAEKHGGKVSIEPGKKGNSVIFSMERGI